MNVESTMMTNCIILLFLIFQACVGTQFIFQRSDYICIVDSAAAVIKGSTGTLHLPLCKHIGTCSNVLIDYHFSQNMMYYIEGNNKSNTIKSFRFPGNDNLIQESLNDIIFTPSYDVKHFVVDWVNDKFYIVFENIIKGLIIPTNHAVQLETVISREDLTLLTKKRTTEIKKLYLDPYRKLLFILVGSEADQQDRLPSDETFIIKSDLNGTNLKVIASQPFTIDFVQFCVDVSEMKLHLSYEDYLYKYDYDGDRLKRYPLPSYGTDISAFGNYVYLISSLKKIIYEMTFTDNNSRVEITKVYNYRFNEDVKFKVLDIRAQRMKENNAYKCDRKDCQHKCEVLPSGDTCYCKETDAKTIDGIHCYYCGQSALTNNAVIEPTIVDGKPIDFKNFPWHVNLYTSSNWDHFCGGSLISSRFVLTAAHCITETALVCPATIKNKQEIKVAMGKSLRSWNLTESAEIKRNISEIIVHAEYCGEKTNYAHDIALLQLEYKVEINNFVMPVCLDFNHNQLPSYDNFHGYMAGFGYTEECGSMCSSPSDTLLYTQARVMSFNECHNIARTLYPSTHSTLTADKICIGNGSVSAVQPGDSGGGLTLAYHKQHFIMGIVSHKLFKKLTDSYYAYSFGAFTNVNEHMEWIKQHISDK